MKKLLTTALAIITILSVSTTAFAERESPRGSKRTTVKVGYLENCGMIITPIVQGSEGYGYEFLEKLEDYTNYDFEYVELSWAEGLEQLKSGEIDLLAPASMSEERKEDYDFVDAVFLQEETNIYVLEDSNYHYGDPEQLNGGTVSTMEGSIYEKRFEAYAKEHNLDYTLTHANSSEIINDMKSGEIDVYVDGSLHLQDGLDSIDKICTENLYFMTKKGNDSLKSAISAAILALETAEPYYNEFL